MMTCLRLPTVVLVSLLSFSSLQAEDKKTPAKKETPKITYDEHILPLLRQRCGSCHNANDAKGGLVLDTFIGLMQGGGSGDSIEPGDSDSSYLFMVINRESEPYMPPKQPKIPEKELALIKQWINSGALENKGSKYVKKKNELAKIEISTKRPAGPPVLPVGVSLKPVTVTQKPNSITALASSPWAPLMAVSGFQQILLYNTQTGLLSGVLPFPEGTPQILKFSRNGQLLMAGGGQGGASGRVIVWDVKTGKRVAELGNDYDAVLAADISSDHALVVMCGPKRMVRVYSVQSGELLYERKKHTDWVMAAEFSPDGVLLATADRSAGMVLWEAMTGNEYLTLKGHTKPITDISWRPDSNSVASCSDDGTIRLWELNDGREIKRWNAHGGGVSAIEYTRDARIVSVGRDRVAKLWQGDGKAIKSYGGLPDLGLEVAYDSDLNRVIAGDWTGQVRIWDATSAATLFTLTPNPPGLNEQLVALDIKLKATQALVISTTNRITATNNAIAARKKAFEAAKAKQVALEASLKKAVADKATADKKVNELVQTAVGCKKNNDQLKVQLGTFNKTLATANKTAKDRGNALAKQTTAKKQADKIIAELNKKVQDLTKKGEAGKAELAKVTPQLQQAKAALVTVTASVTKATTESVQAVKAVQLVKAQIAEFTKKRDLAKQRYNQIIAAQKVAAQQSKTSAAQVKSLTAGIANQKKQVATTQKVLPITAAEKKVLADSAQILKENQQLVTTLQAYRQGLQKQIAGSAQASAK